MRAQRGNLKSSIAVFPSSGNSRLFNATLCIVYNGDSDGSEFTERVGESDAISILIDCLTFEARARIIGPADIYVKTGSSLTLTCLMSQGPHDLGTVAWYRENQHLDTSPTSENDVDSEPRITVETEWSEALTSRLRIIYAKLSDSGNYSCVPTVAEMATVKVHVINGSEFH